MKRRLIYIDTIRGFFMFYLIWLHAFNAVVYNNNPQSADSASPWIFILFAPLVILATWAPVFVIISGTSHAYTMHQTLIKYRSSKEINPELNRLFMGGLTHSFLLIFFSFVNMLFCHHRVPFMGDFYETLLTGYIHKGSFPNFSIRLLLYNDALAVIGTSLFIIHVTLYLIWRSGKLANFRFTLCLLTVIGAVLFFIALPVHHLLTPRLYHAIEEESWVSAWVIKFLLAPLPDVGYGFFGAVFGIALSERVPLRFILRYGYRIGLAFIVLAVSLLLIQGLKPVEFTLCPLPLKLGALDLGLMLWASAFLIQQMEYSDTERRERWARWTLPLRRLSMVALSIFLLEGPIAVTLGRVYLYLLGVQGEFPKHPGYIIPFILIVLTFWFSAVKLWERFGFRYGAEWFSVRVVGWVKRERSQRLNPNFVLYSVSSATNKTN